MSKLEINGKFKEDFTEWLLKDFKTFDEFENNELYIQLDNLKLFLGNDKYVQDTGVDLIESWNSFIEKYNNIDNHLYKNLPFDLNLSLKSQLEYELSYKIDKTFNSKTELNDFLENELFYSMRFIDKDNQEYTFYYRDIALLKEVVNISR
ncbi:hypothetical protein [Empedobacter falsenii]|uniref:hypothetical protein n=1 Tax=Empedobacter falsenii TaxID=343874 RepID=UPI0025774D97|nr:hypothetical protein [Empedobacter falsenii]MDM1319722.1 hypothetical protein [Empedobacter falsenii]